MGMTATFRTWELSPLRIGAGSATIGLHLVAFGLMLLPMRLPDMAPPTPSPPTLIAEIVARVAPEPLPAPPPPNPPQRPPQDTRISEKVDVIVTDTSMPLPIAMPLTEPSVEPAGDPAPLVADQSAQLAYETATAPPYPSIALRRGWEGTVMLRVRVDETGRPREVVIERSSGRTLLDRAASEHVLAHWRFQAAIVGGHAVTAWALVPVQFKIERS